MPAFGPDRVSPPTDSTSSDRTTLIFDHRHHNQQQQRTVAIAAICILVLSAILLALGAFWLCRQTVRHQRQLNTAEESDCEVASTSDKEHNMPGDPMPAEGSKQRGVMRSASLKLKRLFRSKTSLPSASASTASSATVGDVERWPSAAASSSSHSSASLSSKPRSSATSCALTQRKSRPRASSRLRDKLNLLTFDMDTARELTEHEETEGEGERGERVREGCGEGARLWIRASTFEWTWNWDTDWTSPWCAGEVAPVFPQTLDLTVTRGGKDEVSPRSSEVDMRGTLTRLPNCLIDVGSPTSSYFSDDSDSDSEDDANEQEQTMARYNHTSSPQPRSRLQREAQASSVVGGRRRSHTLPTSSAQATVVPIITVSPPSQTQSTAQLKRAHTYTIRRKPPPPFIEPPTAAAAAADILFAPTVRRALDGEQRPKELQTNMLGLLL